VATTVASPTSAVSSGGAQGSGWCNGGAQNDRATLLGTGSFAAPLSQRSVSLPLLSCCDDRRATRAWHWRQNRGNRGWRWAARCRSRLHRLGFWMVGRRRHPLKKPAAGAVWQQERPRDWTARGPSFSRGWTSQFDWRLPQTAELLSPVW